MALLTYALALYFVVLPPLEVAIEAEVDLSRKTIMYAIRYVLYGFGTYSTAFIGCEVVKILAFIRHGVADLLDHHLPYLEEAHHPPGGGLIAVADEEHNANDDPIDDAE